MEEIPDGTRRFLQSEKGAVCGSWKGRKSQSGIKNGIARKIEAFAISDNRNADLEALKAFSTEWRDIGFIPRKNLDAVMTRFRTAMDKHYDALSAARSERSVESYGKRIEKLASGDNNNLRREQNILRDKITRLQQRITSTEENMERFTGKGAESIREQAAKTIKNYRREIDEIKAKLKMLREASNPPT